MESVVISAQKSSLTVKTVGGSSSSTTNTNYSFVHFWVGVFKIFFCVYSGRRVIYNVFVQFWDGVFKFFFCAYSGRRIVYNFFVQFWDGVKNIFFCAYSGRRFTALTKLSAE